jgi:tetratricopeptide (TPR) repeat protein
MRRTRGPLLLAAAMLMTLPCAAAAQWAPSGIEMPGRVREPFGDPRAWIAESERRLAADSSDVDALRLGALALVTAGQAFPLNGKNPVRDSLFSRAERWARSAARLRPNDADVQFALAMAIGNAALAKSPQERVRSADEIWRAATQATQLDPAHDGAWHTLGRWHAEMLRVSPFERFFAKQLLGAAVFDRATWDEAVRYLERARSLDSLRITHRLDLAEVYLDRKRWDEARRELDAVRALPLREANDTLRRREGEDLRRRFKAVR